MKKYVNHLRSCPKTSEYSLLLRLKVRKYFTASDYESHKWHLTNWVKFVTKKILLCCSCHCLHVSWSIPLTNYFFFCVQKHYRISSFTILLLFKDRKIIIIKVVQNTSRLFPLPTQSLPSYFFMHECYLLLLNVNTRHIRLLMMKALECFRNWNENGFNSIWAWEMNINGDCSLPKYFFQFIYSEASNHEWKVYNRRENSWRYLNNLVFFLEFIAI